MKNPVWSAAVGAMDPLRLHDAIQELKDAGCDELHVDIMDGRFVRDFGSNIRTVEALRNTYDLPVDVHLMTEEPERHLTSLANAGCTSLTVHAETASHVHRTLNQIRDLGMAPGIAINPGTPLTKLEYLFSLVDRILLLGHEHGSAAAELSGATHERVRILRENLDYQEQRTKLQVEGTLSASDAARVIARGADVVVVDSPAVIGAANVGEAFRSFVEQVNAMRNVA